MFESSVLYLIILCVNCLNKFYLRHSSYFYLNSLKHWIIHRHLENSNGTVAMHLIVIHSSKTTSDFWETQVRLGIGEARTCSICFMSGRPVLWSRIKGCHVFQAGNTRCCVETSSSFVKIFGFLGTWAYFSLPKLNLKAVNLNYYFFFSPGFLKSSEETGCSLWLLDSVIFQ